MSDGLLVQTEQMWGGPLDGEAYYIRFEHDRFVTTRDGARHEYVRYSPGYFKWVAP